MEEVNKYNYTPLPEPVLITEQEWPEGTLPLVHTRTMTYMHENFIHECIEGILMQKTTFPVQVLIHDDASTDKTAEIVREYELKYPKLIKAYYQKENTYSKKDKTEKRKLRETFTSWRIGKYEALCEGDDYWTDPLKLQKQVEFLEEKQNLNSKKP
jgi:glycosyltransferase involved in cell wall biosynthesis